MNVRPLLALAALAAPLPALGQQQPVTIAQAVEQALELNVDFLRARLQALSATQDLVLARSNILPTVGFNASYGRVRIGGGEEIGRFTLPGTSTEIVQIAPEEFSEISAELKTSYDWTIAEEYPRSGADGDARP